MGSVSTTRRARRGMMREWRLHALSVFSLTVAFVCLGASLLVVTNLYEVQQRWARAGRASVYLRDRASHAEVEALRSALTRVTGVTGVRYVSSGDAKREFASEMDDKSQLGALPVEAFPASLEVDVAPTMTDAELTDAVTKMKQLPAVDDVETYQSWTERLTRLVRGGVAASALLAVVVLSAVLAVVGSTMRLVLQRRRAEVEVLKLVGATDGYVKRPFIVEGSIQGALGALGAIGLLAVLFALVRGRLDAELAALLSIEPSFLPWQIAGGLVALGAVLGAGASLVSLRKLVAV